MEDLRQWLGRQRGPGSKFPSARQLALAISGNRNQNVVANIERNGVLTFETARGLARATKTPVVQILLMAGVIEESEIEATTGELLSGRQLDAAKIIGGLPDDFADTWLESGEALRRLAGVTIGTPPGVETETRETGQRRG